MSIIERAIQKSLEANPGKSRRSSDAKAERATERSQRAAAIEATARIRAVPLAVQSDDSRERRVLLQGDEDGDRAAVAAYRMLRTRLLHRARTKRWVTIGVTSAGPNDGKTLTALNLACSMAREKSREVVLLDMDMRNPSVCRALGAEPRRQLRDYLEQTGGEQPGGGTDDIFFSVGSDNLLIAGSTTPTALASELLSSQRFDQLINEIKVGTVDPIVLIDLPPVLVTDDALVVAPKIDAFIVVTSERMTNRADLTKALDVLSEFPIAGLVLNRAIDNAPGYEYGYDAYDGRGDTGKEAR
jgi:protein-tyrosine kinase